MFCVMPFAVGDLSGSRVGIGDINDRALVETYGAADFWNAKAIIEKAPHHDVANPHNALGHPETKLTLTYFIFAAFLAND